MNRVSELVGLVGLAKFAAAIPPTCCVTLTTNLGAGLVYEQVGVVVPTENSLLLT